MRGQINPDTIMPPYHSIEGLYRVQRRDVGRPILSAQERRGSHCLSGNASVTHADSRNVSLEGDLFTHRLTRRTAVIEGLGSGLVLTALGQVPIPSQRCRDRIRHSRTLR